MTSWHRLSSLRERELLLGFAAVGGLSFVVDTTAYVALEAGPLEGRPLLAKAAAVALATAVSYLLNSTWSFRARATRRRLDELGRYVAVCVVALLVNTAPLWGSRYALGLATPAVSEATERAADLVSAQLIGTAAALGFRWWAFRMGLPCRQRDGGDHPDEIRPGSAGPERSHP